MPQANEVSDVFIEEFRSDAKLAYQRMGTKLLNTVQTQKNVVGTTANFPKFGAVAEPAPASGSGDIPIDDVTQDMVPVTLAGHETGILRKNLDLLQTNTDQKMMAAKSLAWAFGRLTDRLIIDALSSTSLSVGDYTTAFTKAVCMNAMEALYDNDVPDGDGQVFGVLSNHAWNEFKNFSEVKSRDHAGELYPWLKGRESFVWNNIVWMNHSALPLANTDDRDCFLYHKYAVAHASGSEVDIDIDWVPMKRSWLIGGDMLQGADLIDGGTDGGVVKIKVDDDTAIS